jgi:hypothetical protein
MHVRIRQKQSIQLQKRSPHKALVNRTPEKTWSRRKPTMKRLRVFGCSVYVLKPSETYSKPEPKNTKCTFVGYNVDSKAY